MLRPDSPLRGIHEGYNLAQTNYLEGLRFCFDVTELAYRRLESTLAEWSVTPLHRGAPSKRVTELAASAMMDAWTIVDCADRARNLLSGLPGLKGSRQVSPGKAVFLARTESAAKLRNIVQHMRSELQKITDPAERAWGTLHWLFRSAEPPAQYKSYAYVPGRYRGGTYGILSVLTELPTTPVARILLRCRNVEARLSSTYLAMATLANDLELALGAGAVGQPQANFDMLLSLELRIDPTSEPDRVL